MLLTLALLAPWLALLWLWLPWTRRRSEAAVAWASLPALLLAVLAVLTAEVDRQLSVGPLHFTLDPMGRDFLLFSALVWWVVGLFTPAWMAGEENRRRFTTLLTLTLAGSLGLILAADLLTFYLFFGLASLAAWGLILAGPKGEATRRAGRSYLGMMVLAELALLTGIAAAATVDGLAFHSLTATGTGRLALAALALGCAIKLGVLGVHFWLPPAHATAPLPASAVLSGVLIKAGLLGWLRVAPADPGPLQVWSSPLLTLGLLASLYAALMGLMQSHPKRVLAYSTVSQVGLILVALALTLGAEAALTAEQVAFVAGHHALAKATAFLGLGLLMTAAARQRLPVMLALAAACGVLVGLPGSSGAVVKSLLAEGLQQQGGVAMIWLLSLTSIATTCVLLRFLLLAWRQPRPDHAASARPGTVLAWAILLAATLLAAVWLGPGPVAASLDQLWPAMVGLLLAAGAMRFGPALLSTSTPGFSLRRPGWLPRPSTLLRLERHLLRWRNMGRLMLLLGLTLLALLSWPG